MQALREVGAEDRGNPEGGAITYRKGGWMYSDDRERLIQDAMFQNGGNRVQAELETRTQDDIRAAGRIVLTGGRGGPRPAETA